MTDTSREALIKELLLLKFHVGGDIGDIVKRAADMLEADAQELDSEHSPAELRQMLDESFAEKKKCWFAIGQLQKAIDNLIKERDVQQVAVPMTLEQIEVEEDRHLVAAAHGVCLGVIDFARAIEAHHKITPQGDKP